MRAGNKFPTDGGVPLKQNPFVQLGAAGPGEGRPDARMRASAQFVPNPEPEIQNSAQNRGRVDLARQTAGRGGKTVTVISGFLGISRSEMEQLGEKMQRVCGAGGTVKDGRIEIQGDQREQVARILTAAGFRPVFTGG
jgi:translation initiation factor 1